MKLYRCTVRGTFTYPKKSGTVYIIADSKNDAKAFALKHIRDDWKITSIAELAEQLGARIFSTGNRS